MDNADKAKLDSIAEGANNYVLPVAKSDRLGGVMLGRNILLDTDEQHIYVEEGTMYRKGIVQLVGDIAANATVCDKAVTPEAVVNYVNGLGGTSNALSKDGGTMTGNLILNADPTDALGAATKQYVDAAVAGGGGTVTIDTALSTTSANPVANSVITATLANKVDSVTGKGLSTNDYDNAAKAAVDDLIANPVTVDAALSATSTNAIANKAVAEALANKVDAVTGKGLSTNDFTDVYKDKIDGITEDATKVESSTTNGKIKIDGTETTVYAHPSHTAYAEGLYKITVDTEGHISNAVAISASDLVSVIPVSAEADNAIVKKADGIFVDAVPCTNADITALF